MTGHGRPVVTGMDPSPLTRAQLVPMRQSVAATKTLPPGQILLLLDEVDRLLAEREEIVSVMADLASGPWPDLKRRLSDLERSFGAT